MTAFRMKSATLSGCDTMGTWLLARVSVVAFIRLAESLSTAGGIVRSSEATMYQEGFVCHAAVLILSLKHRAANGPWTA